MRVSWTCDSCDLVLVNPSFVLDMDVTPQVTCRCGLLMRRTSLTEEATDVELPKSNSEKR